MNDILPLFFKNELFFAVFKFIMDIGQHSRVNSVPVVVRNSYLVKLHNIQG